MAFSGLPAKVHPVNAITSYSESLIIIILMFNFIKL
jgi:hypothetical protein